MNADDIKIALIAEDAFTFQADVLALKYAQSNYGLDGKVSDCLVDAGYKRNEISPDPNEAVLVNSVIGIAANKVLFVGVVDLFEFGYAQIRSFSLKVLSSLSELAPETTTVALTLHGANYGLDEFEAFESELAGLVDGLQSLNYPTSLKQITFVERSLGRANRLRNLLDEILPSGIFTAPAHNTFRERLQATERLRSTGYDSQSKDHVFVAMPFKQEMDDVFHYGIQGAIRAAGFLCERADLSTFTGDVMEWVRARIRSSKLLVADLTEANPNVYLEVGYAWGCGVPVILLINDVKNLKFDVQGQRCLPYCRIKDLEEKLTNELKGLLSDDQT